MGEFIIKRTKTGFNFYLIAGNKQTVCTSQVYTSLTGCKAGVESLKKNAGVSIEDQTLKNPEVLKNPKYELYLDTAGEYRFRLKASNGENIIASQGYTTKGACKHGIESISKNAPDAEVFVEEIKKEPPKGTKPAATAAKTKPAAKAADKKPTDKKPAVKKDAPKAKPAAKKPAAKKEAKK